MQITLTPLFDVGVASLPPDIVWLRNDGTPAGGGFGGVGDFAVAAIASDGPGGLVAKDPLRTAVILCLMTDCRVEDYEIDAGRAGDRRGWPGDAVDVGEGAQALGSKLWLLRRMDLSEQTALWAQAEAKRALQPLITQGACVRVDALATPDYPNDRMSLRISLYGRDGAAVFTDAFDLLWKLTIGSA